MQEPLIQANETILVVAVYGKLGQFVGDSPAFGKVMTTDQVLDELSERTVRVLKVNPEEITKKPAEDITEYLAQAWILRADGDLWEFDEAKMPAYVLNSRAWAVWQDGEASMAPVAPYSTLDRRTQGLSTGGVL